MLMPVIQHPKSGDTDALHTIWLHSVRVTHTFLTEEDIAFFSPMVREMLASDIELWAVYDDKSGVAMGFMALAGPDKPGEPAKLEALFIDPDKSRQGLGTLLVRHAQTLKGSLILDVNEQNPDALAFYIYMGFTETGRSPVDGAGKPFPLIHMQNRPTG